MRNEYVIILCDGPTCMHKRSKQLEAVIKGELAARNLQKRVRVMVSGCLGMCSKGPVMVVNPKYTVYGHVTEKDIPEIIEQHVMKGRPVARLAIEEDHLYNRFFRVFGDVSFFGRQMRIALRNCGIIDPESIDDYLSVKGYEALARVLTRMSGEDVIAEIKKSGLRGRGGAGFPTGLKWEITARAPGTQKYVICNADEGDPGAFMDRSLLEGDPHAVLEGMIIAGYAIGAQEGIIYCRAEYPLAIKRLTIAIEQARKKGFLGHKILGSEFSFDINIMQGAGAFVCGEETALIASVEGKRGVPRVKPPFPAHKGVWGKPTLINNVETFGNIPAIINKGAEWFSSIGTAGSKGTKVFALAGKVRNTGLVEVPMGTTIRQLIFGPGGGMIKKKVGLKGVQLGGPSGGCLPESLVDTPIDFESITKTGAIMGSGGIIIMDKTTCMVDVARYFLSFTVEESCGQCTPCRVGLKRMLEVLEEITAGRGTQEHITFLKEMGETIKNTALCGLGNTAPNPAITTLRYFPEEYEAHVKDRECPAHVCTDLLHFEVIQEACVKCGACFKVCPVDAITWKKGTTATIDRAKCTKCKSCYNACNFMAIR